MQDKINKTFTGTVDQLLEHCNQIDFDISENEIKDREYEFCIQYIMEHESVDRNQAIELYNLIALIDTAETMEKLTNQGLVEVCGYTQDGEPKFRLTELGKRCSEEIEKNKK